jgi:hypothetical protein
MVAVFKMVFVMLYGSGLRECVRGSVGVVGGGMEIGAVVNSIFPTRATDYK